MSVFAWAHGVTVPEAVALAARFPGLGLVLYPTNYGAAPDLAVPPIAYLTLPHQAETLLEWHAERPFLCAIVGDEPNHDDPRRGHRRITPERYREQFQPVYGILRGHLPVHTASLAPVGSWWQHLLRDLRFDWPYHRQLPDADGRSFAAVHVRLPYLLTLLAQDAGPWMLNAQPFRGAWDRFWEPMSVRTFAGIAQRESVRAVALWCLREVQQENGRWQSEHGLLDRDGQVTAVGRAVRSVLTT